MSDRSKIFRFTVSTESGFFTDDCLARQKGLTLPADWPKLRISHRRLGLCLDRNRLPANVALSYGQVIAHIGAVGDVLGWPEWLALPSCCRLGLYSR